MLHVVRAFIQVWACTKNSGLNIGSVFAVAARPAPAPMPKEATSPCTAAPAVQPAMPACCLAGQTPHPWEEESGQMPRQRSFLTHWEFFFAKSREIFLSIIIFNKIRDHVLVKWLTGHAWLLKALSEATMCTRMTGRMTLLIDLMVDEKKKMVLIDTLLLSSLACWGLWWLAAF